VKSGMNCFASVPVQTELKAESCENTFQIDENNALEINQNSRLLKVLACGNNVVNSSQFGIRIDRDPQASNSTTTTIDSQPL
jgi:hypothetical protein